MILRDLDWEIRGGEHWVLLGPNGCGKSTLLGVLCGYRVPTAGRIEVLGQEYGHSDWTGLKQRIGLVSSIVANQVEGEELAEDVVLSGVYGMINFWGRARRRDRERAAEIMDLVHASHLRGRPWQVLSQGERQRVLVGRALHSGCDVMFLDEPCAGLDPVAREGFLGLVDRLTSEGTRLDLPSVPSLVLVTHHVEEITPGFSHALLLAPGGRVCRSGPISRALNSAALSEAFGAPVTLRRMANRRYAMRVDSTW